jgi:hypothetical protein
MVSPGIVNPSMAMKCIVQIPVVPIDTPASSSQRVRDRPWWARARVAQRRPRKAPRHDIRNPRPGVSKPYEKL